MCRAEGSTAYCDKAISLIRFDFSSNTLYHYVLGREASYPWYDLLVLLGAIGGVGGVGLIIGQAGLLAAKWRRDPALRDDARIGMDATFLVMLSMTSITGLTLVALRATPAMGMLLAIHLGVVFALS